SARSRADRCRCPRTSRCPPPTAASRSARALPAAAAPAAVRPRSRMRRARARPRTTSRTVSCCVSLRTKGERLQTACHGRVSIWRPAYRRRRCRAAILSALGSTDREADSVLESRSAAPRLAGVVATLLITPAAAQSPDAAGAPPSGPAEAEPIEEIEVRGRRMSEIEFDLRMYVRRFVEEITAPPMG